jgi:hypothetical protein
MDEVLSDSVVNSSILGNLLCNKPPQSLRQQQFIISASFVCWLVGHLLVLWGSHLWLQMEYGRLAGPRWPHLRVWWLGFSLYVVVQIWGGLDFFPQWSQNSKRTRGKVARPFKERQRNHIVSAFFWSKQVTKLPRFEGKETRFQLLMGKATRASGIAEIVATLTNDLPQILWIWSVIICF